MDSAGSHKDFCAKEGLHFLLLSDPDAKVSTEYDSVMEYEGSKLSSRNTYIIGPDGKIAKVFPDVDPGVHAKELLGVIASLKGAK